MFFFHAINTKLRSADYTLFDYFGLYADSSIVYPRHRSQWLKTLFRSATVTDCGKKVPWESLTYRN